MSEAEPPEDAPLIVTAELPHDLHRWATGLRTQYFPPERNYLEAHVTLFHALPGQCLPEFRTVLKRIAAEEAPPAARLEGIMSLGGGTALKLSSPEMLHIRDRIADNFTGMLTRQDQHAPRLHVTIQNKVTSAQAKALQAELSVEPRSLRFRAVAAHYYRGGPWERIREWPFRGA